MKVVHIPSYVPCTDEELCHGLAHARQGSAFPLCASKLRQLFNETLERSNRRQEPFIAAAVKAVKKHHVSRTTASIYLSALGAMGNYRKLYPPPLPETDPIYIAEIGPLWPQELASNIALNETG